MEVPSTSSTPRIPKWVSALVELTSYGFSACHNVFFCVLLIFNHVDVIFGPMNGISGDAGDFCTSIAK